MIELSKIRIDGGTQARVELNQDAVADYAEAYKSGVAMPAVTVFYDGSTYWLADGFHRFFGAKQAGLLSIIEDVIPGTQREAVLFSLTANSKHGLRRTNADKRKAVETLLADAEWAKWSDEQIAQKCGVGRVYVISVRKDCILLSDDKIEREPVKRIVKRNGKTFEMDVSGIGKSVTKQRPLTKKEIELCSMVMGECVYLLASDDRVKVGWTRHGARGRIETLLAATPTATVMAVAIGGNSDERKVHKILECDRDSGEWFICSTETAIAAMEEAGLSPHTHSNIGKSQPAQEPEYNPEDDALAEAHETVVSLSNENDALKDRIAAGAIVGTEEEKTLAFETIESLRAEVKRLEISIAAVTASRDRYMNENAEMKRQLAAQRRQIDKAMAS